MTTRLIYLRLSEISYQTFLYDTLVRKFLEPCQRETVAHVAADRLSFGRKGIISSSKKIGFQCSRELVVTQLTGFRNT